MNGDRTLSHRRTAIYSIACPDTGNIRYVGKSVENRLKERWACHLRDARANKATKCHRWIRGLLISGKSPVFSILEWVDEDWAEAECRWIKNFRIQGANLLNQTDGGQGPIGRTLSPESIEKTRSAHIGSKRSEEAKARMRAAWTEDRKAKHIALHKGKTIPDHVRAAISSANKGRKRTPDSIEAGASKRRGRKQTPEQRKKSGEGISRSWTNERREAQSIRFKALRMAQEAERKCEKQP